MSLVRYRIRENPGLITSNAISHPHSSSVSSPALPWNCEQKLQSTPLSSYSSSKISTALLFILVVLAVIIFTSGLLHLLARFLSRQRSSSVSESTREIREPAAVQRQLQQLFNLHDSGLDQVFIDALPVFQYKEVMGVREPFDCAVCLCEFSKEDKLRLLPMCSHAFHIDCIDTWLLSSSSCPLCRGTLYSSGLATENPACYYEYSREEGDGSPRNEGNVHSSGQKPAENEVINDKRVFSLRLGKFRYLNSEGQERREVGDQEAENSSSNLGGRRCYSMGSYQYVVADSDLQVSLISNRGCGAGDGARMVKGKGRGFQKGNSSTNWDNEGNKIAVGAKNESFSVSKIWLWSKKGKNPSTSEACEGTSGDTLGLPWTERWQDTRS